MEKLSKLILILCVLSTEYYCSELIPHITYHANGNVKWSGTIDSLTGKKEGEFKQFTRYGKLLIQGSYKNDEREGQWKSYYHQSDQLYDIGSYKAGDYIGEWKYFHRNGQIRKIGSYYEYSEGFFWNGFRHGEWKYYDEDGKLYKTEYHEKDSITKTMKF